VELDLDRRELAIKLVYYGPALSGKTTNLQMLHARAEAQSRGKLLSLDTQQDRTLFFDLLPLHFRSGAEPVVVKLRVYTVPGQVEHNATRKVVLQSVDGVAFVADSRVSETEAASAAFANLKHNLRDNGLDPEAVPMVLQFNKRDLPDVRSTEELARLERRGRPVYAACALRDEGVLTTFFGLCKVTWDDLERRHGLAASLGLTPDGFLREVAALFGKRV
jgi:signal recognition particle receptor subunit beta